MADANTSSKKTVVMKFGGAAAATPEHFFRIADLIVERKQIFPQVIVVVSAMGKTTDQLISLAKQIHPNPPQREYDMLVTVGERISISLLAMALAVKNYEAVSFTGSQSGIITCNRHTEARIVDVKPHRLLASLEKGKIVIVAGFQGVSRAGEITTLGRGGSDTTAVALGAALQADLVEFYKDVPGFCNTDPKMDPLAKVFDALSYEEALAIVSKGAKILHERSLQLAKINGLPLHIKPFYLPISENEKGTLIYSKDSLRASTPSFEES